MTKKDLLHYEILRGTLTLSNDVKVFGAGSTDDKKVSAELIELADVKDAMGRAQYVRILTAAPNPETGRVVYPDSGRVIEPEPVPTDHQNTADQNNGGAAGQQQEAPKVLTFPPGVREADVDVVQHALAAAGLTFETANLLSDEDIRAKTENIGTGRIALIRSIGTANEYPAYTPAPAQE